LVCPSALLGLNMKICTALKHRENQCLKDYCFEMLYDL